MISSTAVPVQSGMTGGKYASSGGEGKLNKLFRTVIPILSAALLFVGVVVLWTGIGYYYGTWGMFMLGIARSLTLGGFPLGIVKTVSIGGIYCLSAILATLALACVILPIFLSKRMDTAGRVAGNGCLALSIFSVLFFITCSLIAAAAYYARYDVALRLVGGCPNVIVNNPSGYDYCNGFVTGYRLIIAGLVLTAFPLLLATFLVCQQMGRFHGEGATNVTTYVERRTDVSVA